MSQVQHVIVYSKPNCVQCKATTRALDKAELEYKVIDVSQAADSFDYLQGLGVMQMPYLELVESQDGEGVVVDSWSGFIPDKIKAIA